MYLLVPLGRLLRPLNVLLMALTYVLGAGIARYLGTSTRSQTFWLGLAGVLLAQVAMGLLGGVFRGDTSSADDSEARRQETVREVALYTSISALAACAVIAYVLYTHGTLTPASLICLSASVLVILLYAVPPLRLSDRGFGELLLAIHIAYLGPAIGFLLQAGTFHLLLNTSILPLTLLLLATYLVLDLPSYAEDLKSKRVTLLIRLGWENALRLHHGLLLAAYALLGTSLLFGYSLALLAPAFLTLPFAALQWIFLRNISRGARPIWSLLTANAIAVFGLTTYFLTLSFWLR